MTPSRRSSRATAWITPSSFWQSRYGKGDGADYLNAPLDQEQYLAFHKAVAEAEVVVPHEFEKAVFFEGCLPIEELARRGVDTLRYGPMKPVGLRLPDGRRPYAVVQLRQENLAKSQLNLVGFQSRMKWGEQQRVLTMIPGLENASFVRFGQIHRNTFINSPVHLDRLYHVKAEAAGAPGRPDHRRRGIPGVGRPRASPSASICPSNGRAGRPSPSRPPRPSARSPGTSPSPTRSTSSRPTSTTASSPSWRPGCARPTARAAYAERAAAELASWMERNVPAMSEVMG